MKIFIYGMYSNNVCAYVGRTVNPKRREIQHRNGKMFGLPNLRMKIFRSVDRESAPRLEKQIIRSFKRKGQATRNSMCGNPQKGSVPSESMFIAGLESALLRFHASPELSSKFKALDAVSRGKICSIGLASFDAEGYTV